MPNLLIVSHTPSKNTRALTVAMRQGALNDAFDSLQVDVLQPLKAGPEHVLACDAVLLATTENFGYMSGALKDFLERVYYPCLEQTQGLPYALLIRAGNDGEGARTSVERIVSGLAWKAVQPPLICRGQWREEFLKEAEDFAATVAAGLHAGIF